MMVSEYIQLVFQPKVKVTWFFYYGCQALFINLNIAKVDLTYHYIMFAGKGDWHFCTSTFYIWMISNGHKLPLQISSPSCIKS